MGKRNHFSQELKYLLELCRYVVSNPVRAKMVSRPEERRWSSYRGTAGKIVPPEWLAAEKVLSFLGTSKQTSASLSLRESAKHPFGTI
jgi:hypothetical protein